MLSTMSRCADYFWNFQNGRHFHGNDQNAKKLKNTKMIIAGYSLATAAIFIFSNPPKAATHYGGYSYKVL
jgi:hypothetical protein